MAIKMKKSKQFLEKIKTHHISKILSINTYSFSALKTTTLHTKSKIIFFASSTTILGPPVEPGNLQKEIKYARTCSTYEQFIYRGGTT